MRFLTAGESHGEALVGILEGFPAGVAVSEEEIARRLRLRRTAAGRSPRQKAERDGVRVLGGVHRGLTTGAPIALALPNAARTAEVPDAVPRPGHADYAGALKYGLQDAALVRERASARETAMRVALGAFPLRLLESLGVVVAGRVVRIGEESDERGFSSSLRSARAALAASPLRCLDAAAGRRMAAALEDARTAGDTLGGVFEVCAEGVPPGLGSHVHWDRRLDARVGAAFLGLNAVRGVELGTGFALASLPGTRAGDAFKPGTPPRRASNHAGGIEGGMSNGQLLVVRAAMKPVPASSLAVPSIDLRTGRAAKARSERSDVCAVPAAALIGEALLGFVLAEAFLEKFGGDSLQEIEPRVREWRGRCSKGRV